MRHFDYKKYKTYRWDNEILNYLSQIHEYKGKQELFLRQKPVEMEKLVEVAKVQSIESSNRIEGIITTSTRIGQLAKEKTTPQNRDEREIAGYRDVLNTIHANLRIRKRKPVNHTAFAGRVNLLFNGMKASYNLSHSFI